jgi:hypothetical protein
LLCGSAPLRPLPVSTLTLYSQVVALFNELRDTLPSNVMDLDFADARAAPTPRRDRDAISITPAELEARPGRARARAVQLSRPWRGAPRRDPGAGGR